MLGKLLKHEFRATGRVMLPLFAAELIMALLALIFSKVLNASSSRLFAMLGALVVFAFGLLVFAVSIMSIVLMVQRFYKNLLGDEGYLMFTLPSGVHGLVWSKLIVSSVWFIATAVVDVAAIMIAVAGDVTYVSPDAFRQGFGEMFPNMNAEFALNGVGFLIEGLVIVFLACVALCLLFYAAMATGYGFAKHKGLLSVVFFFVYQFVSQTLLLCSVTVTNFSAGGYGSAQEAVGSIMAQMHSLMLLVIGMELLYCAVFYLITTLNLQKRLNLE